ncbi:MAG: hypothetical protein RLO81_05095 [Fulvivirga sp.]|uniref:hypothetical protein n=1 Tax=Fulvivirga sp. TaxID=1931237 RepID=UPI0032ED5994
MKTELKLSKHWKKYLLEFVMLFLAVFLGFVAENYRREIFSKSLERKYIKSLIEDTRADKKYLSQIIKSNTLRQSYLDSLSKSCFSFNGQDSTVKELYLYYVVVLNRPDFFVPNELTMAQLKNAGGMSLINNESAVKAILTYDLQKSLVKNQEEYYENYHNKAINTGLKIFYNQKVRTAWNFIKEKDSVQLSTMEFKFISNGESLVSQFGNEIDMFSGIVNYYTVLLEDSKSKADSLIMILEKQYGFE